MRRRALVCAFVPFVCVLSACSGNGGGGFVPDAAIEDGSSPDARIDDGGSSDGNMLDGSRFDAFPPDASLGTMDAGMEMQALTGVVDVAVGRAHACALGRGGRVWCWGANGSGQLGDGTRESRPYAAPVVRRGDDDELQETDSAVAISAGAWHTCVIVRLGSDQMRAACWGDNSASQLRGRHSVEQADVAIPVREGLVDIAAGKKHTCGLREGGRARCWGANRFGQVGNGRMQSREGRRNVRDDYDASDVTAGGTHSCAVDTEGNAYCWGLNISGQLGTGDMINRKEPAQVVDLSRVAEITAGVSHTCARQDTGRIWCWGSSSNGRLGTVPSAPYTSTPVRAGEIELAIDVDAGDAHTCAIRQNRRVACWGVNEDGQLGTSESGDQRTPTVVQGNFEARNVSAGARSTCAVCEDGRVLCWGANESGQLGDGTTMQRREPAPVLVEPAPAGDAGVGEGGVPEGGVEGGVADSGSGS